MMKKKNAVMVADTRNALTGTLLLNLQETNPGLFDEAIVYHQGISEQDKNTMCKIMPCRFVEYNPPFTKEVLEFESFRRFSVMMFPRYEMFKYLDEFETVTWTDTDVIVQGDLSPLIEKAKENGFVANFENPEDCTNRKTDTIKSSFLSFNTIPDKYDMSAYNMCSGLISVSDKLPCSKNYTEWCYAKTIEYAQDLNSPDQGILNLFIQEFKINAVSAGENGAYCVFPYYKRDTANAKIIHSWGLRKFWNSWYLYNEYPKWGENYRKWVSLGGTDIFTEFKPSVSVVIPSYKPNIEYLKQVLDCLLINQVNAKQPWIAFDDIEVILVLEPVETEAVEELVKKYDDKRLILHINESRFGIAKSINTGIRLAKGKYILRMDDDDLSADTRIYKQKVYLDEHPEIELVTSDYEYFGDMNERRVAFGGEKCRAWSLLTCPFDHPTIMFRKDFFEKNNLWYDEERGYVEDWELWLRAFKAGMQVGCIHEVLFWHRWHNGSAGQNDNTPRMMRELVKKNFAELGVDVPDSMLTLVSPWQGKIVTEQDYDNVVSIYSKALELNSIKKLYDQNALLYVFSLRLQEGATGRMDALVSNPQGIPEIYRTPVIPLPFVLEKDRKQLTFKQIIKNGIKKILRPFYSPFKNYLESQMQNVIENINHEIIITRDSLYKEVIITRDNLYKEVATTRNNLYKEVAESSKNIRFINRSLPLGGRKIYLFGTPEYSNIGDSAICLGERKFIQQFYPDYSLVELSTYDFNDYYPAIARNIGYSDLIFFQGGGNLGSRYLNEENVRRRVIQDFPNNKIVILPQTIYFEESEQGKKELEISAQIYNAHKNLTLLTRGEESAQFAKKYFSQAKIQSFVDMALMLNCNYVFERNGILLCIRDLQDESGLSKAEYDSVVSCVERHDENFVKTNNLNNGDTEVNIYREIQFEVVTKELQKFASKKVIITDRLHGLIFAMITQTPCVVISGFNHKIREFCDLVKDSKEIFFIDKNLNLLDESIEKALKIDDFKTCDYTTTFKKMHDFIEKGNL